METSGGAQRFTHEQWPYEPRFKRVNGWRMHYIDEGTGDPVVLLHGNPAWGFLYRKFVAPLTAAGRRVIVPDMIGFGLSEKPVREQAHTLDGHIANLTALLRQLDVRNATMVCHDWGGPTGLGFALSNRDRVRALVIMSTWAWPLPPAEFHKRPRTGIISNNRLSQSIGGLELKIEISRRIELKKSDRAFVSACGEQGRYCYDGNEKWLA